MQKSCIREDQAEKADRWHEMCEALPRSQEGRKRGEKQKRESDKRDAACERMQQSRRAREFQTRGQEAPSSGIPPALEFCLSVADIEEVGEPSARECERRGAVYNCRDAHCVAPPCIGIAPICRKTSRRLSSSQCSTNRSFSTRQISIERMVISAPEAGTPTNGPV